MCRYAGSTAAVIDDDLLPEGRREPFGDDAAHGVDAATGWKRHNERDRTGWIMFLRRHRCLPTTVAARTAASPFTRPLRIDLVKVMSIARLLQGSADRYSLEHHRRPGTVSSPTAASTARRSFLVSLEGKSLYSLRVRAFRGAIRVGDVALCRYCQIATENRDKFSLSRRWSQQ